MTHRDRLLKVILVILVVSVRTSAFLTPLRVAKGRGRVAQHPGSRGADESVEAAGIGGESSGARKGYQFGDISRFLAKQAAAQIKKVTKKEKYEFGDLSRFLDRQAKRRVAEWTLKDEYEFGDLTKFAMSSLQSRVSNFTSRADEEGNPTYQFGDITREVLRRAQEGEYETRDLFLALRVLLSAGVGLTPMMSMLPVRWLLDLVNLGLAQDIGGRLLEITASALDERMKQAVTGDPKYQLGDLTKKQLAKAISMFTGKEEYEFGDISRRLMALNKSNNVPGEDRLGTTAEKSRQEIVLNDDAFSAFEDWDRRFQSEVLH